MKYCVEGLSLGFDVCCAGDRAAGDRLRALGPRAALWLLFSSRAGFGLSVSLPLNRHRQQYLLLHLYGLCGGTV